MSKLASIASNEIEPKPKRRRFSSAYKRKIVAAADACHEPGEIGALLRREGLYSSLLTTWRAQARAGTLEVVGRKQMAKKGEPTEARRAEKLQREIERLRKKLEHAEKVLLAALVLGPVPVARAAHPRPKKTIREHRGARE